ncbi:MULTISPECIES: BNR repeat-containing protein [unclassified Leeuwenhoekiella]|uniref:BNR repeat-containing protein n=1 Tax=unclassified Leeuwenhoekiella TaxID=2615029 RepID=UPI000C64A06A|nr:MULTISPECIES: BNR repeat-containing protein [unclassified Leeuwenhoekiella]MAW94677.1 neuraminidase [Leeuwenhoekiella sp.]MBA82100.1 neuraminidase [Leeuwenhoekiella sp.]|tara:strand:- start:13101 stop:14417 length:1317 start_codon:yes stop_codon:yes gene_type:complete
MNFRFCIFSIILLSIFGSCSSIPLAYHAKENVLGEGWSSNSVNTVIFRQNAVTTHKDIQFAAYYDGEGNVVLAKRKLPRGNRKIHKTPYTGNAKDAHNAISIAVDGEGFLHISWDHHDNPLRYAKSLEPLGLELSEMQPMTGIDENKVSYPQFYNLPSGDLIFMYRSGQSGSGTLVLNRYNLGTHNWDQLHSNLIDGEGARNAYWQAYVDQSGTIHLSWVWRESWDVSTNHDIAYAKSVDGGKTWEKSDGSSYELPITQASAEYAAMIPQNSSLINQTAMTADRDGNPYIANYWNEGNTTQYHVVYLKEGKWLTENTAFRTTGFQLGGGGTKKIPISRPELFIDEASGKKLCLLFRDADRGSKITLASRDLTKKEAWKVIDLTKESVGDWEPNFDKELFKKTGKLHLFVQQVNQVDGEGLQSSAPTPVKILEYNTLPE